MHRPKYKYFIPGQVSINDASVDINIHAEEEDGLNASLEKITSSESQELVTTSQGNKLAFYINWHAELLLFVINYPVGTKEFIHLHPQVLQDGGFTDEDESKCRKDTGDRKRLRHWSRGHLFIVRTCGHIDTWRPIYK